MTTPCHRCGARVSDTQANCPHCGQPVRVDASRHENGTVVADSLVDHPQEESPLWEGAYSPRTAWPLWLLGVVAIASVLGVTPFTFGWDRGLFLSLLMAAIGLGGAGLYVMFRRLTVHYTLTSRRLTCQTGFFVTIREELNVMDIDDVAYSQTRWERLAGVGTIKVMPTDVNRSDFFLRGIRSVEGVAGRIEEASRAERRRCGLFIE